jgi:hypothetical protein
LSVIFLKQKEGNRQETTKSWLKYNENIGEQGKKEIQDERRGKRRGKKRNKY